MSCRVKQARFSLGSLRIGAVAAVGCAILAVGCSSSSTATNGDPKPAPPIESESPDVQKQFDEAYGLMKAGEWEEAREQFRLLQAEHSGDDTAALAELYIARTLLEDMDAAFSSHEASEGTSVDSEVFSLLESLVDSGTADDRIRFGAKSYLAVAHALTADTEQALAVLEDYPGTSLSPTVLAVDRRWIWPLIAEGLTKADRHAEGVVAWGKLHALLREEAETDVGDDEVEEREWFAELDLPPQADLAITRAFEAESHLTERDAQSFLGHDYALVRAVGSWTLIRHELDGDPGPQTLETLQEVFNETSPDFLTIGAADRASELSTGLAGLAGPDRLVIGALVPLRGANRAVGYRALSGMLVAQRSFHAAGEPGITLIIENSQDDVVEAYGRLADEGALAVVGPLRAEETEALAEVVAEYGVPVISTAAERIPRHRSPDDAEEGDADEEATFLFRNFVDSIAEARAAARLAFEEMGDRRAAVVYPDLAYGRTLADAFIEEFRSLGGEVVADVEYEREASDFVQTARQVAAGQPEAVFLPDTGAKVAEISAFFAQENLWGISPEASRPDDGRIHVHYLGTRLWQHPVLLHQADSYVEGAVIPAWYSSQFDDPDARRLAGGFAAIYDGEADDFVAFAYDSINNLRSLFLDRGAADRESIVELLGQGEWIRGATGQYSFGDDGQPRRELRYLTVDDGEWAIYDGSVMTPLEGREEFDAGFDDEPLESLDEQSSDEVDSDEFDEM